MHEEFVNEIKNYEYIYIYIYIYIYYEYSVGLEPGIFGFWGKQNNISANKRWFNNIWEYLKNCNRLRRWLYIWLFARLELFKKIL